MSLRLAPGSCCGFHGAANGRTQLSFFLLLADQAGYAIDLEKLNPDAFLQAMITSFDGDEAPLAAVIQGLVEE
jgi:cell filamentation protein